MARVLLVEPVFRLLLVGLRQLTNNFSLQIYGSVQNTTNPEPGFQSGPGDSVDAD